jgi:hypothetical protein
MPQQSSHSSRPATVASYASETVRVAVLLSGFFLCCGIPAFFGVAAEQVDGEPIVGVRGFVARMAAAYVPLVVVFGWRKMNAK